MIPPLYFVALSHLLALYRSHYMHILSVAMPIMQTCCIIYVSKASRHD